jgi:tRNA-dihydrouridine synthase B
MKRQTGVDVVWIARGAIGNPWIFRDAAKLMAGTTELQPPTIEEQRDALTEHFDLAMQIHGEQMAGRRMRKMGIKYARFHPQAADVKHDFINVVSLTDWRRVIDRWYNTPGPGVWPAKDAVDEVNDDATSCATEL